MTKVKSTKAALISSALALFLCFAMLLGTTFAWFTDSVTSAGNVIQSGELNVGLYMYNGTEYVDISESEKPIFGDDSLIAAWENVDALWEPGKTQIVYLMVKNEGNLALKYNILADVIDGGLVGSLTYAIIDGATKDDADALGIASWSDILAVPGVQTGEILDGRTVAAENGALEKGESDYFALAIHMEEEAGNEYQNKNIEFDITILATQNTHENDSFGDQYDSEAGLDTSKGMVAKVGTRYFPSIQAAVNAASNGDTIELVSGYNTQDAQLTETIEVTKDITLVPNGMYLVSSAPATFTVREGGKLTVTEGSFTIKNTSSNGAAVLVDGGEFVMEGGSFVAHTAVRTTEGKSSTVTLAAGWSNGVTVGFDLKGNDTLNVTGGTLISSKESIISNTKLTLNMSGGTLSGNPSYKNMYNPSVVCNGETVINMTGGKIETGASQSIAVNIMYNSVINMSGDAVISGTNAGIHVGNRFDGNGDNCVINVAGNAKVTANGAGNNWRIGFAIQAEATNTTVNVSENARIEGSSYGVIAHGEGCAINVSDNAYIKGNGGSEAYGIGAQYITITGGTIEAKNGGVSSDFEGGSLVIDNSVTNDAIKISGGTQSIIVGRSSTLTIKGNPDIVGFNGQFVANADDLNAALVNGGNVFLDGDLTLNGQVDMNGGSLNGNGATITVAGSASSNYNIIDCIISTTGGTISNLNVIGNPNNTRALGSGSTGDVVLESNLTIDYVTINKVQYAINGSGKTGNETVTVNNSTLYGWISFSNIKNFTFKNCTLGMGDSYDGYMVVYGNTSFSDCNFEGVFDLGARIEGGEVVGAGSTVTFSNCYYDGVKVTAENFVEFFFYGPGDERDFGNLMRSYTIKVDGVKVDNSAYVND